MTIEPTNKFILEVVKALLESRVPHKAILASIERLEQTIIAEEQRQIDAHDEQQRNAVRTYSALFGGNHA